MSLGKRSSLDNLLGAVGKVAKLTMVNKAMEKRFLFLPDASHPSSSASPSIRENYEKVKESFVSVISTGGLRGVRKDPEGLIFHPLNRKIVRCFSAALL